LPQEGHPANGNKQNCHITNCRLTSGVTGGFRFFFRKRTKIISSERRATKFTNLVNLKKFTNFRPGEQNFWQIGVGALCPIPPTPMMLNFNDDE